MERRNFLKMAPAFPAAAVSASIVLHQDGLEDTDLDVSVLKLERGDTLVLSTDRAISEDVAKRIRDYMEDKFPGIKAMVLGDGLSIDGVLRQ